MGKRKSWVVAAVLLVLVTPGSAVAADSIYWANGLGNSIGRANLDGTGGGAAVPTTGSTLDQPVGIALDPATGAFYIASITNDAIVRANLDGSGGSTLLAAPFAVAVAVDPASGSIYWASYTGDVIMRANLDGTGAAPLDTIGATVSRPRALAIDPASNRIYWTNGNADKISRANLDGTGGGADLDTTGATVAGPTALAIDPASNSIYWTNLIGSDSISRANLDGTGGGSTLSVGSGVLDTPVGLAVDHATNSIYWSNLGPISSIWRANLDGTGDALQLSTTGAPVDGIQGIALLRAPVAASAPVVTGGGELGQPLTCNTAWAGDQPGSHLYRAPAGVARQWTLDGGDLAGASGATYTPTTPGRYGCRVTATNAAGSITQTSAPVTVAAPAPPSPPLGGPVVGGLSPAAGPAGTAVTITGAGFGLVQRVLFGDVPARFTVDRYDRITAIAPAHEPGVARITVETVDGTSPPTAASTFTYAPTRAEASATQRPATAPAGPATRVPPRAHCRVPNLIGRTRDQAAARLRAAHCRLGRVAGHRGSRARVVAQSRKAGSSHSVGTRVSIRLAERRRS